MLLRRGNNAVAVVFFAVNLSPLFIKLKSSPVFCLKSSTAKKVKNPKHRRKTHLRPIIYNGVDVDV